MSNDNIGIFDTPPTRDQVRFGAGLAILLIATVSLLIAVPNVRLREVTAVVPVIDTLMFLSDLVVATLLYVQAVVFRSRALTVLASSFIVTALLQFAHMLTFPGAFTPTGLLGAGLNTTSWLHLSTRAAFPVAVILYVEVRSFETSPRCDQKAPTIRVTLALLAAIVVAAGLVLLATAGHDLLPSMFSDRYRVIRANLVIANIVLSLLLAAAMIALYRQRRSVLDMWLLVALIAWMIQIPPNVVEWGRFTFGFYAQFAILPVWHLIMVFALLSQSSRLYMRLALLLAARQRERDARLMSVDRVAATFCHEIGQPLTALTTSTAAGLNWLVQSRPNVDKAIEAMRDAIGAAHRVNSVTKSLRAMIAMEPEICEFSVNDLVHQTTALLRREMASEGVSLELELDEALPPIQADRVLMQQVLINLLMNAIEALSEIQDRTRRITVRSALLDDRMALLEISDSGAGIAAEELEQIFEAFFTTKATGTGLGLWICRTIVEDFGGRLWASEGKGHGATFKMRLPCSQAPAI